MLHSRALLPALGFALALSATPLTAQSEILKLEATASYYGAEFNGRTTSSGETFDMNALTAAHKTLPFGTLLEVTNLTNGKRVTVRVNDRGPFVANRELDLSYAAAAAIDMLGAGVAKVSIRKVGTAAASTVSGATTTKKPSTDVSAGNAGEAMPSVPATPLNGGWRIQLGSFSSGENANRLAGKLRDSGFEPTMERTGSFVRVVLAGIGDGELEPLKARLAENGYRDWLVRREVP